MIFFHKFRLHEARNSVERAKGAEGKVINFVSLHTRGDSTLPVTDLPVFFCFKVLQECEKEDVHRSFPSPSPLFR